MATPQVNIGKTSGARSYGGRFAAAPYAWALARISMGFIFLWAFLDKTFGLGYSTPVERAWINGGSPTTGFLSGTKGFFAESFQALAGNVFVDWLFMVGLLGIGLALVLGIGMRIAAVSAVAMLGLMYLAATPGVTPRTNPVVDSHLMYAIVVVGLALGKAGRTLGLGERWSRLAIVKRFPALE